MKKGNGKILSVAFSVNILPILFRASILKPKRLIKNFGLRK